MQAILESKEKLELRYQLKHHIDHTKFIILSCFYLCSFFPLGISWTNWPSGTTRTQRCQGELVIKIIFRAITVDTTTHRENKEHKELRANKDPLVAKDPLVHQESLDDQVYPVSRCALYRNQLFLPGICLANSFHKSINLVKPIICNSIIRLSLIFPYPKEWEWKMVKHLKSI